MTLTELQSLASTDEGREQIRVMVAELRGWVQQGNWFERRGGDGTRYGIEAVPAYTTSLDAMAECEAGLTDEEHAAFQGWLILVCEGKRTVSASALHRCMAFILTKQPTKGDE